MSQASSKSLGRHTPLTLTLNQSVSGKNNKSSKPDKTDDAEKIEAVTVKQVKSSPKIKADDSSSSKTKSDEKSKENGSSADVKDVKISNGAQNGATKESNASADEKKVRESSRQKIGPNKDIEGAKSNTGKEMKELNIERKAKIIANQPCVVLETLKEKRSETPKKSEAIEKSETPKKADSAKKSETNKKLTTTEDDKKIDNKKDENKIKDDSKKEDNKKIEIKKNDTPTKTEKELAKKPESPKTVKSDTSAPVQQKKSETIWDDQDMEPLMMEIDIESEKRKFDKTPNRVLRLKGGPPPSSTSSSSSVRATRCSPFQSQNNTSTMVNLSAGSEPSIASSSSSADTKTPLKIPEESFSSGIRNISGRRTFRPMREMSFQNSYRTDLSTYRETYRTFNDSESSINATIGSEINYDSLRTPILHSARKRERMDNVNPYEHIDESPKRPRIDFMGFMGFMASPVTMLRDRLSRSRIQSSTPRKVNTNDDIMIDTVSASNIEDEKIIDDDDDDDDVVEVDNDAKDVPVMEDVDMEIIKKENALEGIDVPPTEDVIITEVAEKKRTCNIM